MSKKLVIVESPAKAHTLEKLLGKDYKIEACGGHVRDLPSNRLGVDIEKDFNPYYINIPGKGKILAAIKAAAKKASVIYLAPDPDREGEAIAWHLQNILKKEGKIMRVEFNEITRPAVLYGISHPREIDLNRVNAQQARRILDRLVGYKISPLLWKKIRKGLSAGRVQSVAVRLLCEREKEIEVFKPQEYWSITANLQKHAEGLSFIAKLLLKNGNKIEITNEQQAVGINNEIKQQPFKVKSVNRQEKKKNPYPPFITSTLQQEAARKLGFSAKKTMAVAQGLYEGVNIKGEGREGLITYMRTDSVRISQEAINDVRKYIKEKIGPAYLPDHPNHYKTKKQAQDAHEAIRPTSVFRTVDKIKESLTPDQIKLYELIWKRFVASQMLPSRLSVTSVDIQAGEYVFRASGTQVLFDGYQRMYIEVQESEEEEASRLPDLSEDENLGLKELIPKQHFTEPPPRYSEATLIRELEKRNIGRPSTYAPIISTIQDRGYVKREAKTLVPTELGKTLNEQLVKHFTDILDYKFTADMEDNLDEIVTGKVDWVKMLKDFYKPFEQALEKAKVNMEKIKKEQLLEEKCPECGKPLMLRGGRFGDFIACSGFPKCKYTKAIESKPEESGEVCDKCGRPMVVKHSRFGKFLACSGYPDCKNIKPILKGSGVKCPVEGCDGEIVERKSKRGKYFYSCSKYPKCKYALWDKPINEKCPKCSSLLVEKRTKNREYVKCSNADCDFER